MSELTHDPFDTRPPAPNAGTPEGWEWGTIDGVVVVCVNQPGALARIIGNINTIRDKLAAAEAERDELRTALAAAIRTPDSRSDWEATKARCAAVLAANPPAPGTGDAT